MSKDKQEQPDSKAPRPGKGSSEGETAKDPRDQQPKGPKHGHGRGSGGGV